MTKRDIPPFEYKQIRLRLLQENDLPLTLKWRNQDHIRHWFFNSDVILPEQHISWFQRYREKDDDFVFIIEERFRNYRPIGQAAIYNIDWERRQAEFGRLLIGEKDASGKGLAQTATKAVIEVANKTLELGEIYLEVYAHNHQARAVYRKAGFIQKLEKNGVLRMVINPDS